jgi:16S rRNA (cytosine1402-N4)-methyltransferase
LNEHVPVLLKDVIEMMPARVDSYMDGTFGRGGHTREIMNRWPNCKVAAVDRDLQAIDYGRDQFADEIESQRIYFYHSAFSKLSEIQTEIFSDLQIQGFDAILLDLGVSSPQLDQADRGFSFYHNGPLDMRMNREDELTAEQIVNEWDKEELIDIFQNLGEIRRPYRVVDFILERRKESPFKKTHELSELIVRAEGWRKKGHHPATRYFMALRLVVNAELDEVKNSLRSLVEMLNVGGRLQVITFHSLEDRIVKNIFKSFDGLGQVVNKKVIQAKWEEKKKNSRARSAKLRVFERTA